MNEETIEFITGLFLSALNNFQIILAMLLVVIVSACFLGRYVVLYKKLVLSSLGVLVLTIIWTIGLNIIFPDYPDNDVILSINYLVTFSIFIYAFIFYLFAYKEKRFLRALEATLCLYLLYSYISTFSQLTVIYFAGGTGEITDEVFYTNFGTSPLWIAISIMGSVITLALFLIAYFGFYKRKKYFIIGIPYRILFVIWVSVFMVIPFLPAFLPSEYITVEERYFVMSFMFACGIILLGLAVPVIVIVSSASRSLREKSKAQEAYLAAELEYIGQYKRSQVETRAFRHDIKNNLALTQMMLEEGHTDEAKEHINDMLGNVSALSPKYITGDEMLDLIISMKAGRMDELGIKFTLDGVADGGLNIKPMDMCSIFANALDNAIEAAQSCETPYVDFNIKRTDKFFVIKITNSSSKKVDIGKLMSSSGYTSKKDKDHHGFGLMNVRHAVENCNGILKAESEDTSFTLSIMMPRTAG